MARTIRPNSNNLKTKAEWGRRAGGIIQFILQLMRLKYPGMTNNFKLVLIAIVDRIRPKGQGGAFPTLERIAEDANVSRETVKRAIAYWRTHGVLGWATKHGLYSNEYTLLNSPLDLRVSVTIQADGQRLKMSLTKGSNCAFVKAQNEPLRHTRGSQTTVTGRPTASEGNLTDGVTTDEGTTRVVDGEISPLDKNKIVGFGAVGSTNRFAASDGSGTARESSEADLEPSARQSGVDGAVLEPNLQDRTEGEEDMGWRFGKSGAEPEPVKDAMDIAAETPDKPKKKGLKEAFSVWHRMQTLAKERLKVDLPALQGWELKLLQDLIDTDGYGMDTVMKMVDIMTAKWSVIKSVLKIRDEFPSLNTLRFRAQDLRNPSRFIGVGMDWASPGVGEAARIDAAKRKAELLAQRAAKMAAQGGTK